MNASGHQQGPKFQCSLKIKPYQDAASLIKGGRRHLRGERHSTLSRAGRLVEQIRSPGEESQYTRQITDVFLKAKATAAMVRLLELPGIRLPAQCMCAEIPAGRRHNGRPVFGDIQPSAVKWNWSGGTRPLSRESHYGCA
jgi:hypothetical protein